MAVKKLGKRVRRLGAVVGVGVGAAALVVMQSGAAQASEMYNVWSGLPDNHCHVMLNVQLEYVNGAYHDYAQAELYESLADSYDTSNSGDCNGWLERSTDGGNNWALYGPGDYSHGKGTYDYTPYYYDGPGVEMKACVMAYSGYPNYVVCTHAN